MNAAGEVQAAASAAVEKVGEVLGSLKQWAYEGVRGRIHRILAGADRESVAFLLADSDAKRFVANSSQDPSSYTAVEEALWSGNLWLEVLLRGGNLIGRVPQAIDLHVFSLPFLMLGLLTHSDLERAAEEAAREEAGATGSLDEDQTIGLIILLVGLVLSEVGTHIIIAAIVAGAASAGIAAFISTPAVIAGLIIDAFGIGLMFWGLLILAKVLPPPRL